MKSSYILFLFSINIFSQVGIGTINPNATLDILATSTVTPLNTDGILIPRVDNFSTINPTTAQDGMLVFITGNGTPLKGFYFWNQLSTTWNPIGGNSGVKIIDDLLDGKSNTTGTTIFLGQNAGLNDNGANNNNVGVGVNALKVNSTGFNNVAVGSNALVNNTSSGNTAVGAYSLNFNTGAGIQNTAVGNYSLLKNTTGKQNTAVGYNSGGNLSTGVNNTLLGYGVLYKNTLGNNNTAIGLSAGFNNVTGNGNVFLGKAAGYWETGSKKLYIDNSAADSNNALIYGEFGNYNTSVGNILRTNSKFQIGNPALTGYEFPTIDGVINQVLQTDGNGAVLWANSNTIGTDNQNLTGATLTGTSLQIDIENGTSITVDLVGLQDGGAKKINDLTDGKSDNDGTQNGSSVFLGISAGLNDNSTDNRNVGIGFESLNNNTNAFHNTAIGYQSLKLNRGLSNTAVGAVSLTLNTTGNKNTATGSGSMYSNTIGSNNTALGFESLALNTSGSLNTAVGGNSLYTNSGGQQNVAVGNNSLFSNTIGSYNVSIGYLSMHDNTSGNSNTAIGFSSLFQNTSATNNTAIGFYALNKNTTGISNTSMGSYSLYYNTIGNYNIAFGKQALINNIDGSNNTAIGTASLWNNISGNYNTALGFSAFSNGSLYNYSTALGNNSVITSSFQVRIGSNVVSSIGGFANWTNVSDARFKTNIKEDVIGLDFILKLRPVTYNLDLDKIDTYLKIPDSISKRKNGELMKYRIQKGKEIQTGFIAQEVEKAAQELNYAFSGVDKPKNENDYYGLRYAEFVVPLVKAIQEQNEIIKILEIKAAKIDEMQSQIDALKQLILDKN